MADQMKPCPPADPDPRKPKFALPPNACDTHAHVFGPVGRYPWGATRGYTPPDALPAAYEHLHKVLGITRGVITQASVYGTDNRAMLDYVAPRLDRMRAIVSVDADVSDRQLRTMNEQGARGIQTRAVTHSQIFRISFVSPTASSRWVGTSNFSCTSIRWTST